MTECRLGRSLQPSTAMVGQCWQQVLRTLQKLWILSPAPLYLRGSFIVGGVVLNCQTCYQFHKGQRNKEILGVKVTTICTIYIIHEKVSKLDFYFSWRFLVYQLWNCKCKARVNWKQTWTLDQRLFCPYTYIETAKICGKGAALIARIFVENYIFLYKHSFLKILYDFLRLYLK